MRIGEFIRGKPRESAPPDGQDAVRALLGGYSIEVMPKTAAKVDSFRESLPAGTRVYVAHIDGADFSDLLATAKRIVGEGFPAMPHVPARSVPSKEALETWLRRYREEAGVEEALVIAGGAVRVAGPYSSSMDLLETGLFDKLGYRRLHVAGHPEGNRDIDPEGQTGQLDAALQWKQEFSRRTDAAMAITTQFCFDAAPVLAWAKRLRKMGIGLPIHVGVAGPARLQTLIRFAAACGVGASLRVVRRRAADAANLLRPFPPDALLAALAAPVSAEEAPNVAGVHVFPFGGIAEAARWADGVLGVGAREA